MSNTSIYKHFSNGWTGETTYKEPPGQYSWRITTLKRYNGKIASYATAVEFDDAGNMVWDMFGAPTLDLIESTGRATEQTVRDQHYKAIAIFDQMEQAGELPEKEEPKDDSEAFNFNDHGLTFGEGDGDSHIGDAWKEDAYKAKPEKSDEPPLGKVDKAFFQEHKYKIKGSLNDEPELMKGFEFVISATKDGEDWSEYSQDEFTRQVINTFFRNVEPVLQRKKPYLFKEEDEGYGGYRWEGSAYKNIKGLATKEIAALAREEYKATFPEMKWSVTTDVFSGGSSIRAEGKNYPTNPFTQEFIDLANELGGYGKAVDSDRYRHNWKSIYNEKYLKDLARAERILNQYRYDDSNSQIDYFSTNFYKTVIIDLDDWKAKLFPDAAERLKQQEQWSKEWDEKRKARSEKAKNTLKELGILPKWTIVNYKGFWRDLGDKTVPAVITKSPNGRSRWSMNYDLFLIPPKHPKPNYRWKSTLDGISYSSVTLDESAAKLSWPQYKKRILEIAKWDEDDSRAKRYEKAMKKAWQNAQKLVGIEEKPKQTKKPAAKTKAPAKDLKALEDVKFNIVEGKHTKYGYDIWTVTIDGRVDADTFKQLRAKAKENNGYYSSYRGNGATPGFIFKSKADAEFFSGVTENVKPKEHYENWWEKIIGHLMTDTGLSRSDAQGMLQAKDFELTQQWGKGNSASTAYKELFGKEKPEQDQNKADKLKILKLRAKAIKLKYKYK